MRISDWSSDVCSSDLPDDRTFDASSDQTARREGGKIIFSIASNKDLPEKFSGVITSRGAPRGFAVSARREIQAAAIEQVDNHSSELDTTNDRSVEPPPNVAEQGDLSPPATHSAARREGKECVSTCRSGWSP